MNNQIKIAAVVVTYNRLELLKKCIEGLRNQTYKLDEIIVVNNSSTDGTLDWLNEQNELTVITQENSGSAGGQYTGIKTAYEKGYDWIWCLDTDVVVEKDALMELINAPETTEEKTGFLSSTIFFTDGKLCNINIPFLPVEREIVKAFIEEKNLPIISSSFGSVLFSRKAIEQVGYPDPKYYIWGDDVDYAFRMIEQELKGYLVKRSKAIHYAPKNDSDPFVDVNIDDIKMKFGIRNTVSLIIRRNKILYDSKIRGVLATVNFISNVVYKRVKSQKKINLLEVFKLFKYYVNGIFYK